MVETTSDACGVQAFFYCSVAPGFLNSLRSEFLIRNGAIGILTYAGYDNSDAL